MPPAIGGSLTINFDTGISSVTAFGTTITTSGSSVNDISAEDGTTYTGTFVLNSGYAIDTIAYSGVSGGGTLSGYTENDFSLVAGTGGISGTLTITTKEASDPYNIVIKNKEGIKLLTKDKTIEFTDDVKVTIDESLLGGGEAKKYNFKLIHGADTGGNSDNERYSVDGGAFTSVPSSYGGSVELSGNYLVLYGMYGTSKPTIYNVSVTGGTFVGTGLYASSGRYTVIFVTITEDNAEIYYDTYD